MPDHNDSANKPTSNAALEWVARKIHQQICPLVAIETLDKKPWAGQTEHRPESLFCEITGVAHLFDGEFGMLTAVDKLLKSMNVSGQMAIADSVGAAWAVAHYAAPNHPFSLEPKALASGLAASAVPPLTPAASALRLTIGRA